MKTEVSCNHMLKAKDVLYARKKCSRRPSSFALLIKLVNFTRFSNKILPIKFLLIEFEARKLELCFTPNSTRSLLEETFETEDLSYKNYMILIRNTFVGLFRSFS